jgi:transcriptional regulator with XRE-family HTH domain
MAVTNGARIRERRDELDITPAQLAERLGISKGYLRNIENGNAKPARRVVHRIARELAIPVAELEAEKKDECKDEPTHPTRRQDTEKTSGPKRAESALAEAS